LINGSENVSDTSIRWHAPKKYADFKSSGLTAEITEATTDQNFNLTWKDSGKHSETWVEKF